MDERRTTEGDIVVAAPVEDGEVDKRRATKEDIVVAAPVEGGEVVKVDK